jgi:hypothetical protein
VEDESPLGVMQNKDTSFYLHIVKPKLDAMTPNTNMESIVDIDINAWQNFRNYPNGNVNLHYNDVRCPQIFWAQQRISNKSVLGDLYSCLGFGCVLKKVATIDVVQTCHAEARGNILLAVINQYLSKNTGARHTMHH